MKHICCTVFRRCHTGQTEYRFFRNASPIGSASALVLPTFPVTITGKDLTLQFQRDLDQTIFPGCRRPLFCQQQKYADVVYRSYGKHSLDIGSERIHVVFHDSIWHFFQNDTMIAVMRSISDGSNVSDHWVPRLEMRTLPSIPDERLILLLGFPLMQIGI